jgi:hypothetical protein
MDLRAGALFVYLAQPEGLGPIRRKKERANGPTVWWLGDVSRMQTVGPSALTTYLPVYPALQAGLGKLLGLWPEFKKMAQHQNLRLAVKRRNFCVTQATFFSGELTQ